MEWIIGSDEALSCEEVAVRSSFFFTIIFLAKLYEKSNNFRESLSISDILPCELANLEHG